MIVLQPIEYSIINDIQCTSIHTRIIDVDTGQFVESVFPLPHLTDPQKLGSAITYGRRYSLKSLLSLQDEDDDAEAATDRKSSSKGKTFSKSNNQRPLGF